MNAWRCDGRIPCASADGICYAGVRAVQCLSMMPSLESHAELRRSRVDSWRERGVPAGDPSFLGDPARPEATRCRSARLDALGERLLGRSSWNAA